MPIRSFNEALKQQKDGLNTISTTVEINFSTLEMVFRHAKVNLYQRNFCEKMGITSQRFAIYHHYLSKI